MKEDNEKRTLKWIIAILLSIIFGLVTFTVERELSRLDKSIEVLHERINRIGK